MPLSVLYKDFRIANVDLKSCTDFPPKPRYRIKLYIDFVPPPEPPSKKLFITLSN